jgi:N-acetyl sugar amidotransferase
MEVGQQFKIMFWCKNCLNTSTRPRITFDKNGICNACQWAIEKKKINWKKRQSEFFKLIKTSKNKNYDCIVPVSGGKDGSYVAYTLKHKFGLNPLTVTVRPPLETQIGKKNLENFISSGFEHVQISTDDEFRRDLDKMGLVIKGFPYFGWLISIHTAILRVAVSLGINFIIYAEDGEVEYGGSSITKNIPFYNAKYQKKIYLEGGYKKIFNSIKSKKKNKFFFEFPTEKELKNIKITHWSYFENWDPYKNYLIAKKNCGLIENNQLNEGTFTNFAQNDQYLYALHTYIMYLKFGFGRATQDAGIEIRRGSMTRKQAINLVRMYDNYYPENFEKIYLDYYKISKNFFLSLLDKWANKKLFKKISGKWHPKFIIK